MQPNDLPLVCLPIGLSDEAAAQVLDFLNEFTEAFERHYFAQLHRLYHDRDQRQRDRAADSPQHDLPF